MKGFLLLSALLSVAVARPSVLQLSPLSNLQARASASASSSSLPQQLALLRLLPSVPSEPDSQVLEQLETSQENADREAAAQRVQASLARDSVRNVLTLSPLVSSSASASASSVSDNRVLDSLEASLNRAAQAAAAQREEQLRLSGQSTQAAQAQSQQQVNAGTLLSATRLAQSLASLSPTGASSSSSVQVVESPELSVARALQQQQQQAVLLTRESNGLPLLVGSDGQLVAAGQLLLL